MPITAICETCKQPFTKPPSAFIGKRGRWCNLACKGRGLRKPRRKKPGYIDTASAVWIRVDPEDMELEPLAWVLSSHGYAITHLDGRLQPMHSIIFRRVSGSPIPAGMLVDHKNQDPRDNRRANLRLSNKSLNGANRKGNHNSSQPYKGIVRRQQARGVKWISGISRVDSGAIYIGIFDSPEWAAYMYDCYAIALFGDFASTNFEYFEVTS